MNEWFERLSHALLREPQDRTQLMELLHDAKERQLMDADAMEMIEGVLQVSEMKVRDIMIPRPQMVMIEQSMSPGEALPIIIESTHSRFPVIKDNPDHVAGILLAKDLLKFMANPDDTPETIETIVRPAMFIPESKRLDILLKEFRLNKNHMAVVVDEYGGVSGLITIEDVLEQIVGDISDEFDIEDKTQPIHKIGEQVFEIEALTSIDAFNDFFNTDYSHEDFDTIGGLILQKFSYLPQAGESIHVDEFEFTVLEVDDRSVHRLKVKRLPQPDAS